jgi:2-polyprenyl-3-methyl-5-hydroxy-6-metoxy-1,4-benzoquinol methylase
MTSASTDLVDPACGHYAARHRRAFFLAWSHNARFAYARRAVAPFAGRALLDYGCGDGTFLAQVRREFPEAIGADLAEDQIADCALRFGPQSSIQFMTCETLRDDNYTSSFDVVCCMEVLEHCPEPVAEHVLDELARLAAPGALVLISVPVETGPTLMAKQLLRRIAGLIGIQGYQLGERYTTRELTTMVFAGANSRIERPLYCARDAAGTGGYHGHKGFNWRALRGSVARRFEILRVDFTPLPWFRSLANSQVWFVCRAAGSNSSSSINRNGT